MNEKKSSECCDEILFDKEKQDDNCCIEDVGQMIQKLVRVFQLFERDQIKTHGFTSSQCYAMFEIFKVGSLTMNELSEKMNLDSSTMTRVIDKLVRDKLVNRDRDNSDRRIVVVSLTEKGNKATTELSSSVNEYYRKIVKGIPSGEVLDVLQSVAKLLKAFEKANPNCC